MSGTSGGGPVVGPGGTGPRVLGGRYRLERPLAFGGVAEVWTATDLVLERKVAVKLLRADFAADPFVVERFRKEAVAAARLNHPNVVNVFDTVNDNGLEAVIMEFVAGRNLRELIDEEGRLTIADTIHIGIALSDALDAAHRSGLVHRDVKPANVLITPAERVLLTDFGIATAIGRPGDTAENAVLGTAKYLSPEQVLGMPTDARSDLYALGIVLHECLTGQVPFQADTEAEITAARLSRQPRPVRTLRPGVPKVLDELIQKCLTRSPEGRPASAAEVRDALVRIDKFDTDDGRVLVARDATPSRGLPLPVIGEDGNVVPVDDDVDAVPAHRAPRRWWAAVAVVMVLIAGGLIAGAMSRGPVAALRHAIRPGPSTTVEATPPPADAPTAITSPEVPEAVVGSTTVAKSTEPNAMIAAVEYDPPPGDGAEHPGQLISLNDGNTSTEWTSVCYDNMKMLPKKGVGLIFELRDPVVGHNLEIVSKTAGWSASVYVSAVPNDLLSKWGAPVSAGRDIPAGSASFPLGASSNRYILVWFTQIGRSPTCTLPFQMRVAEARVVKAR